MKTFQPGSSRRAFTLVEMLIVLSIIALLAALTMGGYTYAMRSSKRRITTGTFEAIKLALDRYNAEFGEFPEVAGDAQTVDFPPGKMYDVAGAACLYQALTGDGYDQIKGVSASASSGSDSASAKSDGKTEGTEEIKNKMLVEIPPTIWTRKGSTFIIIDGFGHPFQYVKAGTPTSSGSGSGSSGSGSSDEATTINSTYDLWSYAEDDVNTMKKSVDTLDNASVSVKWIKNW